MSLRLQLHGFLATPPLWESMGPINIPQYLTSNPISLPVDLEKKLLIPENLVLGKRVEYFFSFYIKHFTSKNLIAQNIVIQNKTTIGEIDFIIQDKRTKDVNHVELVYKFYLYDPDCLGELEKWVGPNRKDTMVKKLNHLKNHQFPLLFREESRHLLESLPCSSEEISQKACFKANLFVPFNMLNSNFPLINTKCIRGYWIRMEDFIRSEYEKFTYHIPKKADWSIDPSFCDDWYCFPEIENRLLSLIHDKRSTFVWMRITKNEFRQFFIVWW